MNLMLAFNLGLSRIQRIGYHRCVTAHNLVGAPLPIHPSPMVKAEERSGPRPSRQIQRTNRKQRTRLSQMWWDAYNARRRAERAALRALRAPAQES